VHVRQGQILISGWRLDCTSVGGALECQLRDEVTARANNAVISASIRQDATSAAPLAIVQIPLGTAIDDAVRVGFNNGALQRLPVRTCNRNGCFASGRLGQPVVAGLRAAKAPLRIAYDTLADSGAKQTVTISLGLDGFASAFARLH
jgi:invasion protein IalB